jgi:hypothetical protein
MWGARSSGPPQFRGYLADRRHSSTSTTTKWHLHRLLKKSLRNGSSYLYCFPQQLLTHSPVSKMVIKEDGPDKTATARDHVNQLDQLTAERDGLQIPEVDSTGYRIREEPFGTRRKLRVVLMGAGASTVNFLKKAEESMQNLDVTVYEKNHDVGGTWLENRYPGCACDVCFA